MMSLVELAVLAIIGGLPLLIGGVLICYGLSMAYTYSAAMIGMAVKHSSQTPREGGDTVAITGTAVPAGEAIHSPISQSEAILYKIIPNKTDRNSVGKRRAVATKICGRPFLLKTERGEIEVHPEKHALGERTSQEISPIGHYCYDRKVHWVGGDIQQYMRSDGLLNPRSSDALELNETDEFYWWLKQVYPSMGNQYYGFEEQIIEPGDTVTVLGRLEYVASEDKYILKNEWWKPYGLKEGEPPSLIRAIFNSLGTSTMGFVIAGVGAALAGFGYLILFL